MPRPLVVTIPPPPPGTGTASPTGQVFSGGLAGFGASFIFAAEEGTISSWAAANGTNALLRVNNAGLANYKGLALANNGSGNFLYAANFKSGAIDVFDSTYAPTTLSGAFVDPTLPAGYKPFNIQAISGNLIVTYALGQAGDPEEDQPGAGFGYVSSFDGNGNFQRRLASGGVLNVPWGVALASAGFGDFAGALLIGNFGDGKIHAFDPVSGALLGALVDDQGDDIMIEGLWALQFGNGGSGGVRDKLYFTAGIDDEQHGLFGSLAVPEPAPLALLGLVLTVWLPRQRVPAAAPSRRH